MIKEIWINLPVKNLEKSKKFYTQIGFKLNAKHPDTENSLSFFIGEKNVVLMLFPETTFKNFSQNKITDTTESSEVLFSIDAESRNEVDEIAKKVEEAGGSLFGEPAENQGWMYGCGFTDLDGHRWNVLFMDMEKAPA